MKRISILLLVLTTLCFASTSGKIFESGFSSLVFQSPLVSDTALGKWSDEDRVVIILETEDAESPVLGTQEEKSGFQLEFIAWNMLVTSSLTAIVLALAIYLQKRDTRGA